jgi:hypothetical protein
VASDAISKGVTEYLRKVTSANQYEVLANRVENAIGRYRTEHELERERELVDSVLELTPVGIVVPDESGDVVVETGVDRRELVLSAEPLVAADGDVERVVVAFATSEELGELT